LSKCYSIDSGLKVMKYLLLRISLLKCDDTDMDRKGREVVLWSPHKNRFKKLLLLKKIQCTCSYKIIFKIHLKILQKILQNVCKCNIRKYTYVTSSTYRLVSTKNL